MNDDSRARYAMGGLIADTGVDADHPPRWLRSGCTHYVPERDGTLMTAEQAKKFRPLLDAISASAGAEQGGHLPPASPDGIRAVVSDGEAWIDGDALNQYGPDFFAALGGGIPPENIHPVVDAGAVPLDIRKISAITLVPLELLNPTPPDPADVARWKADEVREDARHAELLAAGGAVAAVAELHGPDEPRRCKACEDGDFMACWPCTTWELLDETVPR